MNPTVTRTANGLTVITYPDGRTLTFPANTPPEVLQQALMAGQPAPPTTAEVQEQARQIVSQVGGPQAIQQTGQSLIGQAPANYTGTGLQRTDFGGGLPEAIRQSRMIYRD